MNNVIQYKQICIQRKDGYSLKEDKRGNTQNNEQNNFAHYRDTNTGLSKLSFRTVDASSVGEQSSSRNLLLLRLNVTVATEYSSIFH